MNNQNETLNLCAHILRQTDAPQKILFPVLGKGILTHSGWAFSGLLSHKSYNDKTWYSYTLPQKDPKNT